LEGKCSLLRWCISQLSITIMEYLRQVTYKEKRLQFTGLEVPGQDWAAPLFWASGRVSRVWQECVVELTAYIMSQEGVMVPLRACSHFPVVPHVDQAFNTLGLWETLIQIIAWFFHNALIKITNR
jgi:hypothetical protein